MTELGSDEEIRDYEMQQKVLQETMSEYECEYEWKQITTIFDHIQDLPNASPIEEKHRMLRFLIKLLMKHSKRFKLPKGTNQINSNNEA